MATPYVKFLRGTQAAYENLETKSMDTLYFISEVDSSVGKLYLGDILIAGNVTEDGTSMIDTLAELNDVNVTGLKEGQFLQYNGTQWVPTDIEIEKTNIYADVVPTDGQTHIEAIQAQIPVSDTAAQGDIGIIKELIADDKYQYTAYIYNGTNWVAMDGNYNAENVYFDTDLTYTSAIGVLTVPSSGSGTIEATGKNLREVLAGILAKEKNPTTTKPSAKIVLNSLTKNATYEAGTTISPSYSTTFEDGNYTYGPSPTGSTVSSWSITDSKSRTSSTASGTFDSFVLTAGETYKVSATASYTDGLIPITNIGNEYAAGQIKAGTTSTVSSYTITGYQQGYYIGTVTDASTDITSSVIRGLSTKKNGTYSAGTVEFTVPVDAAKIIIAVPSGETGITQVLNTTVNADMTASFVESTVSVQAADLTDTYATDYKVYTYTPANAYGSTAALKITLG